MLTLGGNDSRMHDSSACIVRDGRLLFAVAEERLSRIEHDAGFPGPAIQACLDFAQARPQTLEKDVHPLYWRLIDEFGNAPVSTW